MILTDRLDLIPATLELIRAELRSPAELARELAVTAPRGWPPELYGQEATRCTLNQLERDVVHAGRTLHDALEVTGDLGPVRWAQVRWGCRCSQSGGAAGEGRQIS